VAYLMWCLDRLFFVVIVLSELFYWWIYIVSDVFLQSTCRSVLWLFIFFFVSFCDSVVFFVLVSWVVFQVLYDHRTLYFSSCLDLHSYLFCRIFVCFVFFSWFGLYEWFYFLLSYLVCLFFFGLLFVICFSDVFIIISFWLLLCYGLLFFSSALIYFCCLGCLFFLCLRID